jgi:Cof subfamily protein (haloacid dehalogenase superfamily)
MIENRAPRLLLADVDGTLVTDDKRLTQAAIAAVQGLRRAGIAFAITSSRPPVGLKMLIAPLDLKLPLAGLNGGLYVAPDLSVIACHTLDTVAAQQAVALLLREGLDVWVYTQTDWLVRDPAAPHVAREAWILKVEATVVPEFTSAHLAGAVKIVGVSDDLDRVAACEGRARIVLRHTASAARSNPYFLDVTHPQANKGAVVLTLSRMLGIAPAQIATIGDMPNDVLMFLKSGLSIAMGNASDAVKAQAKQVTETNEHEGFAKAVRNFILPGVSRTSAQENWR